MEEQLNIGSKAVAESSMIKIGGLDQHIFVRGNDREKPIILILHGGPGSALSTIHSVFRPEFEESFIVAHWDQRGAGKSYSDSISAESMNIEQFVNDTIEVTDYLLKKYNKEKIYLLGLSWGSIPGILSAHKQPDKYYAYIGSGQIINVPEGERISYQFLLDEAKRRGDNEAVAELTAIEGYPYKSNDDLMIERKWLNRYGYGERSMSKIIEALSEEELGVLMKGFQFANEYIMPQVEKFDIDYIKEIKIPVYFFMGRDDYQTPAILVEGFCSNLKAPKKEIVYFDSSAHAPIFEEQERFIDALNKLKY